MGALGASFLGPGWAFAFSLEGVMLLGGLMGALSSHLPAALSLLIAGGAGAAFALLLVFPACRLRNDRVFSSLALCSLSAALAMMAARLLGGVSYSRKAYALLVNGENVTVFLPAALGLALAGWLFLYRTRWGTRLRLCVMNAGAAKRSGVRVGGVQCLGAALFGFLGGIGGLAALIALGDGWQLKNGVGGMGLMALAAMIAGKRRPLPVIFSCLILGLARAAAHLASQMDLGAPDALWPAFCFFMAMLLPALAGKTEDPHGYKEEEE